jgi:hypothetical protein
MQVWGESVEEGERRGRGIAFGYSVASDQRHCWGCGESTERSAGKSGWKWDVPAVYLNLEYGDPRDVAMQKVVQGM